MRWKWITGRTRAAARRRRRQRARPCPRRATARVGGQRRAPLPPAPRTVGGAGPFSLIASAGRAPRGSRPAPPPPLGPGQPPFSGPFRPAGNAASGRPPRPGFGAVDAPPRADAPSGARPASESASAGSSLTRCCRGGDAGRGRGFSSAAPCGACPRLSRCLSRWVCLVPSQKLLGTESWRLAAVLEGWEVENRCPGFPGREVSRLPPFLCKRQAVPSLLAGAKGRLQSSENG